ncbi:MAG TPA: histidine kinase [Actinotalea caeni]|uniref:sensor histidine kinase n=1 Tax=Actinotalea caeni TaxID=1348467 RepID=UPI002B4B39F8|nr:histidine kinase [Actinotalea caeni]HLV55694.1 histidine kinase [Actinotalea caeni]
MTTTPAAARWLGRSDPERFEVMTRWTIYTVFALLPFAALSLVANATSWDGPGPAAYLVLVLVHTVLAARVFVPSMRVCSGGAAWPRTRLRWLAVTTVATVAVAVLGFPGPTEGLGIGILVPLGGAVMAVAPLPARLWTLVGLALASGAVAAGLQLAVGQPAGAVVPTLVVATFSISGIAISCRLSVWMLAVVWELDDARRTAARLAVAEERLRFSRDLHDTFGRALSTVAVKSELAAALAERGDARGPEEMLEVRRIAHETLREVRELVQGYRSADLDTEIAGARALLRSAAIECRVAGEGLQLPAPVAEAVAWVVREAVTNVVRHAHATRCDIDVRVAGDVCRVRVVNDGAPDEPTVPAGGSGLRGLRERLGARGGALTATSDDGTFVVEATVPMTALGGDPA